MKRLPNPSVDSSLGVPEFPEKSCQNNWNPHPAKANPVILLFMTGGTKS